MANSNNSGWVDSGWMQTFTNAKFDPADIENNDFRIEDIAHALSNLCRFGGHCSNFYSVAQHSVIVSHIVPSEMAKIGLLHDASEAYMVDMPRPLKALLPEYKSLENKIQAALAKQYKIKFPFPKEIHQADIAALALEYKCLFSKNFWDPGVTPADPALLQETWNPNTSKYYFLQRFHELF